MALKLARVSSTEEKILVKRTSGCAAWQAWPGALTPRPRRATSLASLVFITWKPTTGRPFRRAKPRTSEAPSPTSATSVSFTNRPPPVGMFMSRSAARVSAEPRTRSGLLAAADVHPPAGGVDLEAAQRVVDLGRRQAVRGQPVGVDDDVDLAVDAADAVDLGDALLRLQGASHGVVHEPGELAVGHGRSGDRIGEDRAG